MEKIRLEWMSLEPALTFDVPEEIRAKESHKENRNWQSTIRHQLSFAGVQERPGGGGWWWWLVVGGCWWLVVVGGGWWWWLVVAGGWWLLVVGGGWWWLMMISGHCRWFLVVSGGLIYFQCKD